MVMDDIPRIQPNRRLHWGLFAVATFEAQFDHGPMSGEIHDTAGVFDNPEDVYDAVSRLFNEKEVLDRERDGRGYRYTVNEDGVKALWILGVPTEGPEGENSAELGFDLDDLSLPEWVLDTDTGYDADKIPLREYGIEAEDPGGFESSKARKRFFATLDREGRREWEPQPDREWEPGASHEGEITFEGEESLVDEVFGSDESEPEEDELPPVEREGIDPDTDDEFEPEPEVPLASFDPDSQGHSPRHEAEEEDVPETISFEPEWDWVGVQMAKLGYPGLARRAFKQKMTPAEVYGPVMELIYENRFNSDAELDLTGGDRMLTVTEAPVSDEAVQAARESVGVE